MSMNVMVRLKLQAQLLLRIHLIEVLVMLVDPYLVLKSDSKIALSLATFPRITLHEVRFNLKESIVSTDTLRILKRQKKHFLKMDGLTQEM